MKYTIFNEKHKAAGAKMVEFAGFEMPVEYSGVTNEHINVREKVGLFDVSHMGEFWIKGDMARDLVQKITSNDVDKLEPGKIQYSCFPNGKGGIVDDLLVYKYEKNKYLLVVNASNMEKDWAWVKECNTMNAEIENASDDISQVAVQGPMAVNLLQKLTDTDLSNIPYYSFKTAKLGGIDEVIISNTGYTGAGGFELYFYSSEGNAIWDKIMEAGKEFGILPAGLASRDTLRLEMGFCLYGNEINDTTSPLEAGLGWITKFTENNNFIDKEFLLKQKEAGLKRKLVGFEMIDRGIPRQHYTVVNAANEEIGEVTSGTMSPMLKKGIGMAYVKSEYALTGREIFISVRNKDLKAQIVKLPFYKAV
ncbi:MAG: glycine cleavage system aminomethyltransferase GcvT [Bacteroidales bacterium]|nr:glycine cleavage system aminomethyltransferase GcvT [Bacteroidales bacterium]